ncbi:hypothetical protein BJ912DRAFT_1021735 [Pholiota molesta]|nr:hypothetical protein BJ912DRAFT_1021735 [Pholiota molesta]
MAPTQPVPLPSAPLAVLRDNVVLQPPLSRHGTGPGVIVFLPRLDHTNANPTKSLDPEPVSKWAEEGFAVVGVTASDGLSVEDALKLGLDALQALDKVDIKESLGLSLIYSVSDAVSKEPRVAAFIGYGSFAAPSCTIRFSCISLPTHLVLPTRRVSIQLYTHGNYAPGSAAIAHSRTLVFLRKWLGGPFFDLEAIWDEHTYYEFEARSVAKTMGTMVAEPYVNHVPTVTFITLL